MTEATVFLIILSTAVVIALLVNAGRNARIASGRSDNFFSDAVISARNSKRDELIVAIDEGQFVPYIQLIYDVARKKVTGGEVLARWNHPDKGLLGPRAFVDDMNNLGISDKLDFLMFEATCKMLHEWEFGQFRDIRLSCNFTRRTVSSTGFGKKYEHILNKYDFDHGKLTLEITEDAFFDNVTVAFNNINTCARSGVRIAIDDMGSGYSSLYDLCDYPIDVIKLDREVIRKAVNERSKIVFGSVVEMAHKLGMKVLCEGIESEDEFDVAVEMGCDYTQGYYYSEPLPVHDAMAELLRN